ncbi:endo-1,4-beta-xylanase [Paenibacillus sp. DCT19]|uniref:endo-1,4-beta-xylanase n=1 Tax=Paenibacillus sp. DCT19 TaxID=2211212 RepID=UPI000FE1FBE9|nr:endo-1,4-beta-xylanase [Paenibacillus sp. DCT19]
MSKEIPSLHHAFRDNFKIGAAVHTGLIRTEGDFIAHHYNSITAENQMKFEEIHPEEERYAFEAGDEIVDFAVRNGMSVRGHTLVWHNQTSDWVFQDPAGGTASRELLLSRLKSHIDTVVGRYKGHISAWDVVNEAIEDKTDLMMRDTKWLQILGEDYLLEAFRLAHVADPQALLFYNDYNETDPVKREKIYELVKGLLEKGAPIHGIGMQGHWNIHGPSIEDIRMAIERYASLNVQLHITELDLSVFRHEDRRIDLIEPTAEMMELQEQRYEEIFRLFLEYQASITSVTFWGTSDHYTWLDNFPVRGRKNWPFVFDQQRQPKESFSRLLNAAKGSAPTSRGIS